MTQATVPTMTAVERTFFEAGVIFDKESAMVRGWRTSNSEAVQAKIKAYNEREYARCEAAALALLDL